MSDFEDKVERLHALLRLKKNQVRVQRACWYDAERIAETGGIVLAQNSNLLFHMVPSYFERIPRFARCFSDTGNKWYLGRLANLVEEDLVMIESRKDPSWRLDLDILDFISRAARGESIDTSRLIWMCDRVPRKLYRAETPLQLPKERGRAFAEFHIHRNFGPSNPDLQLKNELLLSYALSQQNGGGFHYISLFYMSRGRHERILTFR